MPDKPKPGVLRNLRIKRVALVDNGANFDRSTGDGAHIMLFKRDTDKSMSLGSVHVDSTDWDSLEKDDLDAESRNALPDSAFAAVWTDAQGKKHRKLPIHDAGHLAAARGRISQADIPADVKAAAQRRIDAKTRGKEKAMGAQSLWKSLIELIKEPDAEKRLAKATELEKAGNPFADGDEKPVHKADDPMCKCADCVSMRASKLDKLATDEIEREKTEKAAREAAERAKMPADMQKRFDALSAENVELRKQATEAITLAKAEREARLDNEMREILKSFKASPFDLDKDVAEFRKMKESTPALFERTMAILKAQDAQLEASEVFRTYGTRKGTGEGSAWAQLEAKADAIIEKSQTPLTKEAALERVMLDPKNNKLVKQYRTEATQ